MQDTDLRDTESILVDVEITNPEIDLLINKHYETLKTIARAKRRRASFNHTLLTSDILHESWLKLRALGNWQDENHFLRTAAIAMRHVLCDHARAKLAQKRGEGAGHLSYDDVADFLPEFGECPEQIVSICDLVQKLAKINPRLVHIVDLRYFGGFTEVETAEILGITDRTVRRDWRTAKAWLASELGANAA
ncbi:MAG TPA: sigma-70 family RNA polymerase sigma factor [Hellea balneolensis]|uniref:Sigma-70 family RNA polymerase sigma factor n=1 Tax=Hellea balneolensis TaxID=287478 RepID=A0A7C5LVQ7_9PROT|nr:sigma-70 family RNA polymerase sigma factor [Hellea balneolensis]